MRCASTGGRWVVVLFSIACAGSPPSRAPEPHASAAPSAASAAPSSSSAPPEESWTSDEDDADRDKDHIADTRDRCPDEPERYNGVEDNDGCPDRGLAGYPGEERIFMTFKKHQAERELENNFVIDEVVKLLAVNQDIILLEVGGHAEASEEKGAKKQLSKRRADFVRRVMIEKGVEKTRLVSRAYGSDCPLMKDAELEGDRALNRRISFLILKTTSGPKEPTPCPE